MAFYKKPDLGDYLAERKRNDRKMRSFARMYGKSDHLEQIKQEFATKCDNSAENYDKSPKKLNNCYSMPTSSAMRDYMDLVEHRHKNRKIDPNQAFKERKKPKKTFNKWEIYDMVFDK